MVAVSDYQELVRKEAKAFYEANKEAFASDEGEFGGKFKEPNLLRWIDRTEKLAARVGEISAKWTLKDYNWVQANTRNRSEHGGDARGNAFASLLQDIRHEIKKLAKK
jgi:hypothetical protein